MPSRELAADFDRSNSRPAFQKAAADVNADGKISHQNMAESRNFVSTEVRKYFSFLVVLK